MLFDEGGFFWEYPKLTLVLFFLIIASVIVFYIAVRSHAEKTGKENPKLVTAFVVYFIIAVCVLIAFFGFFLLLIGGVVLFLFLESPGSGSSGSSKSYRTFNIPESPPKKSAPTRKKEEFEEEDSFYDRDSNSHSVDEDGYCEDCDDHHDE